MTSDYTYKFYIILTHLTPEQQMELFGFLDDIIEFRPEGFPDYCIKKTSLQLNLKEIEFLCQKFEEIQNSNKPFLAGKSIKNIDLKGSFFPKWPNL